MTDFLDPRWVITYNWSHPGPEVDDNKLLREMSVKAIFARKNVESIPPEAFGFAKYIDGLRIDKGWTPLDLAKAAWIHPVAAYMSLSGRTLTSEERVLLVEPLAKAFGLTRDQLRVDPFNPKHQKWYRNLVAGKHLTIKQIRSLDSFYQKAAKQEDLEDLSPEADQAWDHKMLCDHCDDLFLEPLDASQPHPWIWIFDFDWDNPQADPKSEEMHEYTWAMFQEREETATQTLIEFGHLVRRFRRLKKLKPEALAQQMRIHPTALFLLEEGRLLRKEFTESLVARVAETFEIPTHLLPVNPLHSR